MEEQLRIDGLYTCHGELAVHGAKNSALPLLAATLLVPEPCVLHNCPPLSDVSAACAILNALGCRTSREEDSVTVDAAALIGSAIPDGLMREMRSSIVFLGPLLARAGQAALSFPGGCELGPRPIDLHLWALRKLGADIREERGELHCRTGGRLQGAALTLPLPSVGATENILLAAVTAEGITTIENAAREPEIADLCAFLTSCGAHIAGDGGGTLVVEGVEGLHGCEHTVIPDRIAAATYLAAAAVTGGSLTLTRACPAHLSSVLPVFEEMGCAFTCTTDTIRLTAPRRLRRVGLVRTAPYPGFPTDAGALILSAACAVEGTSIFVETVFENRYKYVGELCRLGADVKVEGRIAVVEGVGRQGAARQGARHLSGAPVSCTDLRGGAALVIAALAAEGTTTVTALAHLDRGYAHFADNLRAIGAHVTREPAQ